MALSMKNACLFMFPFCTKSQYPLILTARDMYLTGKECTFVFNDIFKYSRPVVIRAIGT